MKKIFFGKIKEGKVEIKSFKIFADDIAKCEGKDVLIQVEDKYKIRSEKQNRYYWGVVVRLVSDHTGFEPEEIHQLFKKKFLSYRRKVNKVVMEFTKSTTELNWKDFGDYIQKIRDYVRESEALKSVIIPDPDPEYYGQK